MQRTTSFFCLLLVCVYCAILISCGERNGESNISTEPTDTISAHTETIIDTLQSTTIQWLDSTYVDVGKIGEEDSVTVVYRFKNIGDKPLIVESINTSCGCTVADSLTAPVLPGAESKIRVKFYAKNQAVATHVKQVFVTANTKPHTGTILTFKVKITDEK